MELLKEAIKVTIVRNDKKESVGLNLSFKNGFWIEGKNGYGNATVSELYDIKKKLVKRVLEDKKEEDEKRKKEVKKSGWNKLLNKVSSKDYLTISEMITLNKMTQFNTLYFYDLLGALEFELTKKDTLKAIDSKDNTIYFNSKNMRNYKFYKCAIELYKCK